MTSAVAGSDHSGILPLNTPEGARSCSPPRTVEYLVTRFQAAVTAVDASVFGIFSMFERILRDVLWYAFKLTVAASNVYQASIFSSLGNLRRLRMTCILQTKHPGTYTALRFSNTESPYGEGVHELRFTCILLVTIYDSDASLSCPPLLHCSVTALSVCSHHLHFTSHLIFSH
jgi:hypothetical protein